MRAPAFWTVREGREAAPIIRALLTPLSWLYAAATARRIARATPYEPGAPVISVGNLTAGGTGKTPVARALLARLRAQGVDAHLVTRGYGGRLAGPVRVDPAVHTADAVGDEPLMLAADAPVWVAKDRAAGARAAVAAGAHALVLDDAHQNPAVRKSFSLVVIDAETGLGNGFVIPAGPLREPAGVGLARADAVLLMGEGEPELPAHPAPVFRGALTALGGLTPGPKLGFCGIGRPKKFEDTLKGLKVDLIDFTPFPDHHPYTSGELEALSAHAQAAGAGLVTTEKDAMRLPPAFRARVEVVRVQAALDEALLALIDDHISRLAGAQAIKT
jgi:tetraacyldisaccharide 4'-kinase